jgi:hypothetical protein
MAKRTRLFLLTAAGILAAVLVTGLIAWTTGMPVLAAFASSAPAELAFVPADARMVAYADVRQLMNSPFHDRVKQFDGTARVNPDGLEARTGINLETDIDHVLVASTPEPPVSPGLQGSPIPAGSLLIARGRFDVTRIEGLMREQGGQAEQYHDVRIISIKQGTHDAAMAFAEPGLILFGTGDAVRGGVDAKAGSGSTIRNDDEFMKLVDQVDGGTAWSVTKMDSLPVGAGLPPAVASQLPPINWLAASGRVDSGLHGFVRADARDAESAKNLRDVVQGFLALAKMQGTRQPQYKGLFDSLALSAEGNSVSLTFEVTPTMLDALTAGAPFRRPGAPRPPVNREAPQRF